MDYYGFQAPEPPQPVRLSKLDKVLLGLSFVMACAPAFMIAGLPLYAPHASPRVPMPPLACTGTDKAKAEECRAQWLASYCRYETRRDGGEALTCPNAPEGWRLRLWTEEY